MPGKTILVIDDDADILLFCKSLLEAHGYLVKTANSGAAGLAAAASENPDLIILDIMMERINTGYEVAETLGRDIPILIFSSMLNPSDTVFDVESAPWRDMIPKPIEGEILLAKVREHLGV